MRATVMFEAGDVRIEDVPDPSIIEPTDALEHTVRLVFGTPQASGFMMWGIWETEMWDQALGAAFYTKEWEPRKPAHRWESLMCEWDTDVTVPVKPGGTIEFTGFYGDYEVTVGGKTYPLTALNEALADAEAMRITKALVDPTL